MHDISAQQSGNRRGRTEEHTLAAVVAASETLRAGMTRHTGFDGDAITGLKMSYGRMDGDDLVQSGCS